MKEIIDSRSLYQTVMNAAIFLFKGGKFTEQEKESLIDYLLTRQNRQKGFVFHATKEELASNVHLISGEKPRTNLLKVNAIELETLRLLALLDDARPAVQEVLRAADLRLEKQCFARVCLTGDCVGASIAYLRYINSRHSELFMEQIRHGLVVLKENRSGDCKWGKFPFYFTLLWLGELPSDLSKEEIDYSRDCARRYLQNQVKREGPYKEFQDQILLRALQ